MENTGSQERDRQISGDNLAGLQELHHLGLANNGLQRVEENFFNSTPNLKLLDLSANRGVSFQDGSFLGLSQLEKLRLISCNIATLPPSVFSPLVSLTSLNLRSSLRTPLISLLTRRTRRRSLVSSWTASPTV